MALRKHKNKEEIPEMFYDPKTKTTYKRLQFLGKGAFAECYEIINVATNEYFAAKIVSKRHMTADTLRKIIEKEVSLHRSMDHPNIVAFHGYFEDFDFFYLVLEFCKLKTLTQMKSRRKFITELECRYYMYHIIQGVKYLHDNSIVHRDLKLDNLFLDDSLHVKIGDFGLSSRIHKGEYKRTVCGTPQYMPPEMLSYSRYSFEVDIWSLGCVMYTLLVGSTPFDSRTLTEMQRKIRKCQYSVPRNVSESAENMIRAMLQTNPSARPKVDDLLKYEFLTETPIPARLPGWCLALMKPLDVSKPTNKLLLAFAARRSLSGLNGLKDEKGLNLTFVKKPTNQHDTKSGSAPVHPPSEDYNKDTESLNQQLNNLSI